jgi:hypothetical protein
VRVTCDIFPSILMLNAKLLTIGVTCNNVVIGGVKCHLLKFGGLSAKVVVI